MDFNANQMREDALPKEGRYYFKVKDARERRSQSGNDMMNLTLILDPEGRAIKFFDSLILMPKMFWKVEHFCNTTGMLEKIDEGRLMAQDCFEKEGYLDLIHKANQETGEIQAVVKDYVKREDMPELQQPDASFDDDVPSFN